MEQVISKSALNNILTAAEPAVVDMDEDTKKNSCSFMGTVQ